MQMSRRIRIVPMFVPLPFRLLGGKRGKDEELWQEEKEKKRDEELSREEREKREEEG